MSQLAQHFKRIIAHLDLRGGCEVYPAGSVAFNSEDMTLRFHDGCTVGGFAKLQMLPRCDDGTGQNRVDFRQLAKADPVVGEHLDAAGELTSDKLANTQIRFQADWGELGTYDETVDVQHDTPIVTQREGSGVASENYAMEINRAFGKYGIVARAMADTLDGKGRVAVVAPANLGQWRLSIIHANSEVSVIEAKAKGETKSKEAKNG